MIPGEELLFVALGGSGEIGMNVNLYGCRGQWIMVDLGLTFAGPDYPGIDLILPNLEFIEDQQERLAGIILTHGHEDHIGALPYLAEELKAPLYRDAIHCWPDRRQARRRGADRTRQAQHRRARGNYRTRTVPHQLRRAVALDSGRKWSAHRNAFRQRVPYGRLEDRRDAGDRRGAEPDTLRAIGDQGVLALVCDSTNVFQDKPSGSEESVHAGLLAKVAEAKGRVLVTTFASNAARLQTIGRVGAGNRAQGVYRRPLARTDPACRSGDRLPQGLPATDRLRRSDATAASAKC